MTCRPQVTKSSLVTLSNSTQTQNPRLCCRATRPQPRYSTQRRPPSSPLRCSRPCAGAFASPPSGSRSKHSRWKSPTGARFGASGGAELTFLQAVLPCHRPWHCHAARTGSASIGTSVRRVAAAVWRRRACSLAWSDVWGTACAAEPRASARAASTPAAWPKTMGCGSIRMELKWTCEDEEHVETGRLVASARLGKSKCRRSWGKSGSDTTCPSFHANALPLASGVDPMVGILTQCAGEEAGGRLFEFIARRIRARASVRENRKRNERKRNFANNTQNQIARAQP